jgi:hypothetical protein
MGSGGSFVLPEGGDIYLAFNDNNGTYGDNAGSFEVTVSLERGGQIVEGPTTVEIAGHVAPCLSDYCGGTASVTGIYSLGWSTQVGDVLIWTASGEIERFFPTGSTTGPDGDVNNTADASYLCNTGGNAWGLVGAVNGWPEGGHNPPSPPTDPCPVAPCPTIPEQIQAANSASVRPLDGFNNVVPASGLLLPIGIAGTLVLLGTFRMRTRQD